MRPVLIALTGPPCSGKTTLAERLAARGARVVPEAAIEVIEELNERLGGPDAQRAWRSQEPLEFQRLVAARQLQRERDALRGVEDGASASASESIIVFDRTSIDGVAYLRRAGQPVPEDIAAAARAARPDLVFELEVLAHAFHGRRSTGRSSTLQDAYEIAAAIHAAYLEFGQPTISLAAALSADARAEAVCAAVERWRAVHA
ncbi:MAG: ATP-binding protein [Planctomycetota bacterium]